MKTTEKQLIWRPRLFAVWQIGKETRWLKSMSARGWHLKQIVFLFYQFEKGEPRDYEYAHDFRIESKTDLEDYRALVEDTGWKYIDHASSWQYFRIDATKAKDAPIYSNQESLKGMYKRIFWLLAISGLPIFLFVLNGGLKRPGFINNLVGVMVLLILYSIIRVGLLIRKTR